MTPGATDKSGEAQGLGVDSRGRPSREEKGAGLRDNSGMPKLLSLEWVWLISVLSPNIEERGVGLSLSREPAEKLKAELFFRGGKPNKDDRGAG